MKRCGSLNLRLSKGIYMLFNSLPTHIKRMPTNRNLTELASTMYQQLIKYKIARICIKHAHSAHKKEKVTDIEQDFEQEKEGRNVQTQIPFQNKNIGV
jgi:hypothetical protein